MAAKEGVEKSGISLDENTTKEDVNFQNIRVKRPVCERCRYVWDILKRSV
jgi:hypothetical protein